MSSSLTPATNSLFAAPVRCPDALQPHSFVLNRVSFGEYSSELPWPDKNQVQLFPIYKAAPLVIFNIATAFVRSALNHVGTGVGSSRALEAA